MLHRMKEPSAKLRGSNLGDAVGIGWFLRDVGGVRTVGHGGSANGQFFAGMICLAVTLISTAMYYGHVLWGMLPVAQKLTFVLCVGWLLALHYSEFSNERRSA